MIDLFIATQSAPASGVWTWLIANAAGVGTLVTILVLAATLGRRLVTKGDLDAAQVKNQQAIRELKEDLEKRLDRLDDKTDGLKIEVVRTINMFLGFALGRPNARPEEEADRGSPTSGEPPDAFDEKVN